MEEVDSQGGMIKAIELGIPKMRIEQAAAKRQARIDSGKEKIIGLNSYQSSENRDVDTLVIDNEKVKLNQIKRLEKVKSERNSVEVKKILLKIASSAKSKKGNLLELSIQAAKARRTSSGTM